MALDPNGESAPAPPSRADRFRGFFERVDGKLMPIFGPADIDDRTEAPGAPTDAKCPVCGHHMTEHVIDRATPNSVLFCPQYRQHEAVSPQPEEGPLNELGMTKRGQAEPGEASR